jgi:sterol desaturase/sphingolipid hydroxylase (fatty acid hydroxylase superfamily)
MGEKEQLLQAITLVVVVLFFEFMERLQPGHAADRQKDLPLNLMALLITAAAGEMWKTLLVKGVNTLNPGQITSLALLRGLPGTVKVISGLILADFCLYWVHRAMHRRTLWRTHMFHHSIQELWWLSGSRTSVTHLFLFAVPQVFLGYFLFQFAPFEAGIAFSAGVVVNIWIHSNIWVDLGPLQRVFITPNYHRIHHGAKGLSSKNLGFILTIWDRMFGTYVDPQLVGRDFALGFVSTQKRLFRMIVGI